MKNTFIPTKSFVLLYTKQFVNKNESKTYIQRTGNFTNTFEEK